VAEAGASLSRCLFRGGRPAQIIVTVWWCGGKLTDRSACEVASVLPLPWIVALGSPPQLRPGRRRELGSRQARKLESLKEALEKLKIESRRRRYRECLGGVC